MNPYGGGMYGGNPYGGGMFGGGGGMYGGNPYGGGMFGANPYGGGGGMFGGGGGMFGGGGSPYGGANQAALSRFFQPRPRPAGGPPRGQTYGPGYKPNYAQFTSAAERSAMNPTKPKTFADANPSKFRGGAAPSAPYNPNRGGALPSAGGMSLAGGIGKGKRQDPMGAALQLARTGGLPKPKTFDQLVTNSTVLKDSQADTKARETARWKGDQARDMDRYKMNNLNDKWIAGYKADRAANRAQWKPLASGGRYKIG